MHPATEVDSNGPRTRSDGFRSSYIRSGPWGQRFSGCAEWLRFGPPADPRSVARVLLDLVFEKVLGRAGPSLPDIGEGAVRHNGAAFLARVDRPPARARSSRSAATWRR